MLQRLEHLLDGLVATLIDERGLRGLEFLDVFVVEVKEEVTRFRERREPQIEPHALLELARSGVVTRSCSRARLALAAVLNVKLHELVVVRHVKRHHVIHSRDSISHLSRVIEVLGVGQDAWAFVNIWQRVRLVIGVHLAGLAHDLVDGVQLVTEQFGVDDQARVVHLRLDNSFGHCVTTGQVGTAHGQLDQHGFVTE